MLGPMARGNNFYWKFPVGALKLLTDAENLLVPMGARRLIVRCSASWHKVCGHCHSMFDLDQVECLITTKHV